MVKITIKDIEKYVKQNGFGLHNCHGFKADFISEGVAYALRQTQTEDTGIVGKTHPFYLEVYNACERFYNGDFGDMYEYGEEITVGNEWGNYGTCIDEIKIHRENGQVTVFFNFER